MKFSKKILAAVLAALMAISMMPFTAFAAPPGSSEIGTGTGGISIGGGDSYLTFTGTESFSIKTNNNAKNWSGTLEYSTDTNIWTTWDGTSQISSVNDVLYLRGTGNTQITGSGSSSKYWVITTQGTVACSGDIRTLLDYNNPEGSSMGNSCFSYLFRNCTSLTAAPALPATVLTYDCYYHMFDGCRSLTTAPELPATTLAQECYSYMFYGCKSLTTAPALPATTLISNCYSYMFAGCTSLTTAPALPATTLARHCYYYMFEGCTSLTTAPELPATTLAQECYSYMFYGCKSLTTAPALPATTLTSSCYNGMFRGCTGIKLSTEQTAEYSTPYSIPKQGTAESVGNYALTDMFTGTGGTFTGTPAINTTYYLAAPAPAPLEATFTGNLVDTFETWIMNKFIGGDVLDYDTTTVQKDRAYEISRDVDYYGLVFVVSVPGNAAFDPADISVTIGETVSIPVSADDDDGSAAVWYDPYEDGDSKVYQFFVTKAAFTDSMVVDYTPSTPAIDPVSYKNAAYDSATNTVSYTDATCDDYTAVAADTTTFENGKWYVVNSNVTVNGRITVNGAANLILADGYTLTVTQGVAVTDPNSLTIYGQENGTGTLTATSTSNNAAGIGGNDDENGPITINGGTVNATSGGAGAGIGGGEMGNGGPVVINGGTVTAIGGEDDGAGIGSGGNGSSCNVTINGGTVNATGRHTYDNTAGIGNSGWSSNGGNIAINGGTVNAACAAGSQGIGGSGCTISITGGTVDVNRGVTDASYGLFGSSFTMSGGEVYVNRGVYVNTTITGGTLIAEANPPFQSDVSIGTGLKVLAGANEESAVEVEPSAINMSSGVYLNSKWIKIYPAPPIKPDGFNLTVEDKIYMNLYINVDDYTDPATATVTVYYNDPEKQTPTLKVDTYSGEELAALKDEEDGRYVIPVLAAPAQIRDNVSVTVTDRDDSITTNVATYCETIIAQSDDASLVNLAKAILDYGKACSAEFNYNVDGFEEQAYYNTDDVSYILDEEAKLNSADANSKFTGYSYIAKAVPALRIYLNTTEAEVVANDLKATVNGTEVEPKVEEGTGRVCVDITGILAEDLHAEYTVEFNGGTLKLNALQYAKAKGGNTDFSRSMCEYWFYAHTYFK